MPVCTTCAHRAEYLHTTYRTKSNIRLNVCARCSAFLDPLIEHPPLLLILDLILLKPRVFLHLLYNRGTRPLDATATATAKASATKAELELVDPQHDARETILREDLIRLVLVTLGAETLVRISSGISLERMAVLASGVALEMLAQYATTTCLALGVLRWRRWWPIKGAGGRDTGDVRVDGRREDFRPILIPLTLLYTSILPLLLHLLLSIWYKAPSSTGHAHQLPSYLVAHAPPDLITALQALLQTWSTTDRIWAGTRLLGGMSAGFGLRVVLPTKPWETTGIVLAGWAAAAGVGSLIM